VRHTEKHGHVIFLKLVEEHVSAASVLPVYVGESPDQLVGAAVRESFGAATIVLDFVFLQATLNQRRWSRRWRAVQR
jgi:hypothetical protein